MVEETLHVGTEAFVASDSPNPRWSVALEDDGERGHFYAYDLEAEDAAWPPSDHRWSLIFRRYAAGLMLLQVLGIFAPAQQVSPSLALLGASESQSLRNVLL